MTGASDGSIRVWELAQQPQNMRAWGIGIGRPGWQRVRELSPRHVLRQPRWSPVMSLRVTTTCEQFVSAAADGALHVWHLALGSIQRQGFDSGGPGGCVLNFWPRRDPFLGAMDDDDSGFDSSASELARLADRAGRQTTIDKEKIHSTRLLPREPDQLDPSSSSFSSSSAAETPQVVTAMDELHDQLIVGTSHGLLRVISLRNSTSKVVRRLAGHRNVPITEVQAAGQAVWSLAANGHVKRWRSRVGRVPLCSVHAVKGHHAYLKSEKTTKRARRPRCDSLQQDADGPKKNQASRASTKVRRRRRRRRRKEEEKADKKPTRRLLWWFGHKPHNNDDEKQGRRKIRMRDPTIRRRRAENEDRDDDPEQVPPQGRSDSSSTKNNTMSRARMLGRDDAGR